MRKDAEGIYQHTYTWKGRQHTLSLDTDDPQLAQRRERIARRLEEAGQITLLGAILDGKIPWKTLDRVFGT